MAEFLYTAGNLTRAARPVVLTIGRASSRPGRRWAWWRALTRWYVARFRTWHVRPISTVQLLALQAAAPDAYAYLLELARVLRAVFPRHWTQRVTGDPVRLVLGLFADSNTRALATRIVDTLLAMPGAEPATAPVSAWEALRAEQRRQVYGDDRSGRGAVTLAVAALCTRAQFGQAWFWNPGMWRTSDGFVPFAVCLLEYIGLQTLDARARLVVADGYGMANARDLRAARRPFEDLAYPTERGHGRG